MVAGAKNNDSFIRVCDVFDYHLDIYAVYFIFPPIFICMQLMCAQCCTPQKAFSIKYHAPCLHILHIHRKTLQRVVSIKQTSNALKTRDAVSLPDFPPNISHSSSLLHSHHNDSQLPCKHHNSLKDVCPDDGLQTTLRQKGTCESRSIQLLLKNKDPTKKYLWVFFAGFLSVLASYFYRVAKAVLTEEQVIPIRLSSMKSPSIYSNPL